jgi:hypothetical protein
MAHFVEVNAFYEVIKGVVLDDKDTQDSAGNEIESIGAKYLHDGFGGTWLRTSYNTTGGTHRLGGTPFRKNYAGVGCTYDKTRDAFLPVKEFPSWVLNEDTCIYESPIPMPNDDKRYTWDEENTQWVETPK